MRAVCRVLIGLVWLNCSHAATPVIEVGASDNLKPDHPTILLLQHAYQQLGYRMKLVQMPLERVALESNKGQLVDAELSRTAEAETMLPNMIRVKVPVGQVRITAYVRADSPIKQWQLANNWQLDALRGILLLAELIPNQQYTEVSTIQQGLDRLRAGRSDVVILLGDETEQLLAGQQDIKALQPDLYQTKVYHYLHQRHAALVPALEQILRELQLKSETAQHPK